MKRNLVQALKKLLVAFGGAKDTSEVTDTNIVPIVDKLADAVGDFNFESKTIHYLIEKQTITSTTNDINGILIEDGKKPYLFNTLDYIQTYYTIAEMAENENDESILKSFIQDYFDSHIVLKINDTIIPINKELSNSSLYGEGAIVWTLEKDNYLIGVLFNCNDYLLGDNFRWFSIAGNLETFLPVNAEYTIEAYEEITQQKETNLNLPIPNEENVGQVLTSIETETDTYAFGFTTPTNNENNNMVITESFDLHVGYILDKTWNEITTHMKSGGQCSVIFNDDNTKISTISYMGTTQDTLGNNVYQVMVPSTISNGELHFNCYTCNAINDYPLIAVIM